MESSLPSIDEREILFVQELMLTDCTTPPFFIIYYMS